MPRNRTEPPDLTTQAGRLTWARASANYPSSRAAARILRWNENTYKSRETAERRSGGIPPDELVKYAEAFRVDLHWLTFGIGSPRPGVDPEPAEPAAAPSLRVVRGGR